MIKLNSSAGCFEEFQRDESSNKKTSIWIYCLHTKTLFFGANAKKNPWLRGGIKRRLIRGFGHSQKDKSLFPIFRRKKDTEYVSETIYWLSFLRSLCPLTTFPNLRVFGCHCGLIYLGDVDNLIWFFIVSLVLWFCKLKVNIIVNEILSHLILLIRPISSWNDRHRTLN